MVSGPRLCSAHQCTRAQLWPDEAKGKPQQRLARFRGLHSQEDSKAHPEVEWRAATSAAPSHHTCRICFDRFWLKHVRDECRMPA